ncbi:MAG TPA: ankyrin repeat domain-containing protein [Alphaproteobacteria bacterium]|nr:ankyrin repeat domain-containing protein [Alphaproteobacteria bacterium]
MSARKRLKAAKKQKLEANAYAALKEEAAKAQAAAATPVKRPTLSGTDKMLWDTAVAGLNDETRKLLLGGANADIYDENGTPLVGEVASHGYFGTALSLVELGADVNAQDAEGNTPIMRAIMSTYPAVTSGLWERGADLDIRNHQGVSARTLLASDHHNSMIMLYKDIVDAEDRGRGGVLRERLPRSWTWTSKAPAALRNRAEPA